MEGLETREESFSKVLKEEDFRLEAEFHIANKMEFVSVKGAEIEEFSQYGTSKDLNEEERGFPVLRLNEFDNFFISKPAKSCDLIDEETYLSLKLQKGDVLICRTNGNPKLVGKAAIVPKDYDYAFASYLFRIRPNSDIINAATLVSFLNSKYGRTEIEKYSMVSNQANFSPAKFRQISIPVFSRNFNIEIERKVFKSFSLVEEGKTLYAEAKKSILEKLDMSDWQPSNNRVNVKRLKDSFLSSGRLDAEYYQSQYDVLFEHLKRLKTKRLGDIVSINKSIEPGSEYYQIEGIPFIRVADITKYGITEPAVYLNKERFEDVIRPQKDTILMSKDGSVGIAYKVEKDEEVITSGAILHLMIKDENVLPDYLTLVINSLAVQMQAERDAGGSIIQHWKPSEIENVIIPILPMDDQIKISDMIQESFRLRQEGKRLLEVAKKAVEIAISENEEKALQYMTENEVAK